MTEEPKRPHLLYLSFWYPPARASGVYRALTVTELFEEAGWGVTVVTADIEYLEDEIGSKDNSLLESIPVGVDVVRVPLPRTSHLGDEIKNRGWISGNFPTLRDGIRRNTAKVRAAMSEFTGGANGSSSLEGKYASWIDPVIRLGTKLSSDRDVAHILATGNPFSSFEAARKLSAITGAGFSVDYRDPWTIDVFTGQLDNADQATTRAERRIISEAELCFHVNDAIARAYKTKYPESAGKHLVVPNGFDTNSIPPPRATIRDGVVFGVLGTLNQRWPLEALFAGWRNARPSLPRSSSLVLGGHLGYYEHSSDILASLLPGPDDRFEYVGPVEKAAVADFYESVDVIVLPIPGGNMVTSGKVYEAMAVGKPIVSIQGPDGGGRALIADHPLGIVADPRPESVSSAFIEAAAQAREMTVASAAAAQAYASRFARKEAMRPMIDSISALVGETAQ